MSSPAFTALVDLCRFAKTGRVSGADLALEVKASSEVSSLLASVESGGWTNTLYVDGVETTKRIEDLGGLDVKIVVHGITRSNQVVANNVGKLLRLNRGRYLGEPPAEYFLLDEDHASWELATHQDVQAYARAIRITGLTKRLADVVRARDETAGEAIILATRKLVIPLAYDSASLSKVAQEEEIAAVEADVFNEHHLDARRDIVKRVLVRFFDATPELDRFPDLLKRLAEVRQAFLADFDVYASGFNFDKAREDFERRKLDFVVKANTASSDVMNKLIAIPVGQGLLASQMKAEASLSVVNSALLAGSMVFAVIALALIANQVSVLEQIQEELMTEKAVLRERTMPTYERLKGMIGALEERLRFHMTWVPAALIVLLAVTTTITIVVYSKFAQAG